jgi:hypothetical protein
MTTRCEIYFYFPYTGTFEHAPSNICVEKKVIAISDVYKLIVGKKEIVKNVETFRNLMLATNGEVNKKAKIVELLTSKEDLLSDVQFKFQFDGPMFWMLKNDNKFYLDCMKVIAETYPYHTGLYQIAFENKDKLLESSEFKEERAFILSLIKAFLTQELAKSDLCKYVFRPTQN